MIHISSLVIVFHRRRKDAGRTNGKIKGKSRENAPNPGRKRAGTHGRQAPNRKEETAENGTKPIKKKLYYAELGASCL